ncbi:MAG: T9SS type A sorting domain-containing protein [Prevotellaceae bacterium]|jgi:hypothetical protein|nr:T9SS type A sorting domain-containing protein [Prevotellaceae bacterium]
MKKYNFLPDSNRVKHSPAAATNNVGVRLIAPLLATIACLLAIGNANAADLIAIQHTYYTEYNMSIHSFYGDIAGQPTGQTGEQKFSYSVRREEYTPPLYGEILNTNNYVPNNSEGQMPQDWNNPATLQNVGWYYGGAENFGFQMPVDWTKILDIANNTQICAGGTLAITDSVTGTVLATYAGTDANGQSILNIDSVAYLQFLENSKTVTHSEEYIGIRYEYQYIGGKLTRIEIEQWSITDSTIYNLSVNKSVGVEIPTGIAAAASGKLQIYISGDELHVEIPFFEKMEFLNDLRIYDIAGRSAGAYCIRPNETINVSNLSSGVYIVKIGNKSAKFAKK